MKRSNRPLILIPRPRIITNRRSAKITPTQITPTLNLLIDWDIVLRRDDPDFDFDNLEEQVFDAQRRTGDFLFKRCGISLNNGNNKSAGHIICGERGTPCITQLTERGNTQMASLINNNEFLRPPQMFLNRPVISGIIVPRARFTDNPSLLGTTLTFGQPNRYSIYIFLDVNALNPSNPWIIAHEIGHALLNRTFRSFPPHDPDPLNLMHAPVPRVSDPNRIKLRPSQIQAFRRSRLLFREPL
ncbi:hypothetical protein QFZ77_004650 [Paenibacillus sp. V4I3]|uniref:hypothetical protein n=1 Tax=Paenibacillus sp. V4I3 TaxID=3042305 RepID=UPI00277E7F66|nr:hypothetical protein [Paenibacillus sp. V4I3]MDQ0875991.1 hypothetical protein [Paenibacillus sp. V4I3]